MPQNARNAAKRRTPQNAARRKTPQMRIAKSPRHKKM
jgi:hypothetical protein